MTATPMSGGTGVGTFRAGVERGDEAGEVDEAYEADEADRVVGRSSGRPAVTSSGRPASPAHAVDWDRARCLARDVSPLAVVSRPLGEVLGQVLARPLAALTDLPPFDSSAMDGWAVAGDGPWRLRGRGVLAGAQPPPLAHGTAVPIATGARLPSGAGAVLRREYGEVDARTGMLLDRTAGLLESGCDIRPQGQESRAGEALLPAGTTVTPAVLGLAAAAGYDRLAVHRRPVVELLVLGDELLESGLPRDGRVRDALGPLLPHWLSGQGGADVTGRRLVSDDFRPLYEALRDSTADVVVTTGSTAAGPVDFLHDALAELGARLLVDSVAVRPGHPMLLAELPPRADGRPRRLVGLPGNPLAAVAGTVTLAVPLLRRLGGRTDTEPARATCAAALPGHPRDTRLLPVRRIAGEAAPLPFDGPAMLRGLALADGLAVVPPGGVAAGGDVEVLPVPGP
ncbi:molybdopterin molybdotransferase MoeA [Streptomyces sp. NPDC058548]|uniref:molybdopterin molybdotransferase MoeA n=1 Tax=Streptomyces sp. NPDC058548 TaxID=3346545 RepID=UPI00365246EC